MKKFNYIRFMKKSIIIPIILVCFVHTLYGQEEKCFLFDENMKKFYFNCDDARPAPSIKSNVDSGFSFNGFILSAKFFDK